MTILKHTLFIGNNYLIHFLKLDLKKLRILNLSNDFAAFLCCFPNYFLLMWPNIEYQLNLTKDISDIEEAKD